MVEWFGIGEFEPLDFLHVKMKFEIDGEWTEWILADNVGDGWYEIEIEDLDEWVAWKVKYAETEFIPIDPGTNPCNGYTNFSFMWKLGGNG